MVEEEKLDRRSGAAVPDLKPSRRRLWRYGPLVLWAALIFIGSGSLLSASNTGALLIRPLRWLFPQASNTTLEVVQFLLRKAAHFTEYAILALLAARAFRTSKRELLRARWFFASLALVVIYSLSDEFHQSFVSTRTASVFDSLIDSLGGLCALTVLWWLVRKRDTQPGVSNSKLPAPEIFQRRQRL
jgi:VanZ family protein